VSAKNPLYAIRLQDCENILKDFASANANYIAAIGCGYDGTGGNGGNRDRSIPSVASVLSCSVGVVFGCGYAAIGV
jgi:hypothetical protein